METLNFDKKRNRVKNCPCGKSNRDGKFVPYVGHEDKGFCHSCDRTFLPKKNKIGDLEKIRQRSFSPPPQKSISYIDPNILEASLNGYDKNNFVFFLKSTFGETLAMEAVEAYKIGTSTARTGANVFWYVDDTQKIRGGKIMLYNPSTGKRQNFFSWSHSKLNLNDFNLKLCFYGEHLLESNPLKDVGLVESEKTAIISSLVFPDFVWLASGGKGGLSPYKFESLRNRNVSLFPDLSKPGDKETCFEIWNNEVERIQGDIPGFFKVSDYFESKATNAEKKMGFDLADYILLKNWKAKNERNEPPQKHFISGQKKTIEDDEEIRLIEKQIEKVIQDIRREEAKESKFRNEIRNSEIPGKAIRANKELLKKYRDKYGY